MTFFEDHSTCGCCGEYASTKLLDEMSLRAVERAALDYIGLARVLREETNDAPYVEGEVRLTELLADNASSVAAAVEAPVFAALNLGYISESRIADALTTANGLWQNKSWEKDVDASVRKVLSETAYLGQHSIAFGPDLSDYDRLRIVNGMSKAAKYYTNRYFNEHVMPAVVDAAHAAIIGGNSHDGSQLNAIRALLDRRLRSVPYWNLVANAAASRAYHFGYIKTGIAKGFDTLRFTAVVDDKTSSICLDLNGTEWPAAGVGLFMDRIADASNVDDVKQIAPWLKPADIAGFNPAQLLSAGVVVPPVHGRCRSQLVFV